MRRLQRIGKLAVACTLLLSAPSARAASDAENEAERIKLYADAQKLSAAGNWSEARDLLQRIVDLRSAPKALIALAYAELKLGHLLRARSLYTQARDDARASSLSGDAQAAQLGVDHVARRIPKLILRLPEDIPAYQVKARLDGRPVVIRDGAIELDPGDHRLGVIALGRSPFKTELSVAEAERLAVAVTFSTPEGSGDVDGTAGSQDVSAGPSPVGPLVVGGIGAVVAVVGVGTWLGGNSDYQDVVDACGGSGNTCPKSQQAELQPRADDARAKIVNGQVLVGVGAAVGVGALIWWAALPSQSTNSARLALTPSAHGGFASLWGAF